RALLLLGPQRPWQRLPRHLCSSSSSSCGAADSPPAGRRCRHRLVPDAPTWRNVADSELPPPTAIDSDTIALLERLSLVQFDTADTVRVVAEAVRFADELRLVHAGPEVEPMTSLPEAWGWRCPLRADTPAEQPRTAVLSNAAETEEHYFVAPPGNIAAKDSGRERLDRLAEGAKSKASRSSRS
ncbi:hypothetical protein BOX15_Mlig016554g2, partial [Macrostomum lignano]